MKNKTEIKQLKKQINSLTKRFQYADYVSMTEMEHYLFLTKRVLDLGGSL